MRRPASGRSAPPTPAAWPRAPPTTPPRCTTGWAPRWRSGRRGTAPATSDSRRSRRSRPAGPASPARGRRPRSRRAPGAPARCARRRWPATGRRPPGSAAPRSTRPRRPRRAAPRSSGAAAADEPGGRRGGGGHRRPQPCTRPCFCMARAKTCGTWTRTCRPTRNPTRRATRKPADAVMYNPFEPGFAEDPYPQYAAIRADGRVHHNPLGLRVLSHYDDCFELLRLGRHQRRRAQRHEHRGAAPARRPGRAPGRAQPLDPEHRPARPHPAAPPGVERVHDPPGRAPARAGARRSSPSCSTTIAAETAPGEPVDLIARFAFPLPFVVISELLGMPDGDRDQLRAWSHEMTRSLEPFADDAELRRIVAAADQMFAHVDDAIEWKRRNPADDLLSGMIAAEEDGDRLSPDELRDQVVLLYLAGHETTVNLIGNGTLRPAAPPRPARAARRRPRPRRQRRGRAAALRQPRAGVAPHRHHRHRDRGRADRRR